MEALRRIIPKTNTSGFELNDFYSSFFFFRVEEEGAAKSTFQKQLRDLQTQMQELQEDLDAEKEARNKAEKLKRDLNEVGIYNGGKMSCSLSVSPSGQTVELLCDVIVNIHVLH